MKKTLSILLLLALQAGFFALPAVAESLVPLDLGMPFAVIYSETTDTVDVYEAEEPEEDADENKERRSKEDIIDVLPNGYIVQILAVYGSECRVYYFDEQNLHHIGHIYTSTVHQLTIAGLLSIMADAQTADYMQQFIGQSMPYVTGSITPTRSADAGDDGKPIYVINKNTKRIHLPSCGSINDIHSGNFESYDGSLEDAVNKGYKPCKRCLSDWYIDHD